MTTRQAGLADSFTRDVKRAVGIMRPKLERDRGFVRLELASGRSFKSFWGPGPAGQIDSPSLGEVRTRIGSRKSAFRFGHYVSQKLHELRALPSGWDGEGSVGSTQVATYNTYCYLTSLGDGSTVYPFITPDGEGGLLAEWRAGQQRIEIEVDLSGRIQVLATDSAGNIIVKSDGQDPDQTILLRKILADLSARVRRVNPNWRSLFIR